MPFKRTIVFTLKGYATFTSYKPKMYLEKWGKVILLHNYYDKVMVGTVGAFASSSHQGDICDRKSR